MAPFTLVFANEGAGQFATLIAEDHAGHQRVQASNTSLLLLFSVSYAVFALRFCERDNREPPTIVRLYQSASAADLVAPDVPDQAVVHRVHVAHREEHELRGQRELGAGDLLHRHAATLVAHPLDLARREALDLAILAVERLGRHGEVAIAIREMVKGERIGQRQRRRAGIRHDRGRPVQAQRPVQDRHPRGIAATGAL